MAYIRFPIETDPEILVQEVYDFIRAEYPGWVPSDGNLDVMIARAMAFKAAENRDLATDVQDDIFMYFGSTLIGIPPIDAVSAIGSTTWTTVDALGHLIPAGTQLSLADAEGNVYPFYTIADVVVAAGTTTTPVGAVSIQALVPGVDSSNLIGTVNLIDVLDYVQSVTLVGSTAGGVDAETVGAYLDRLVRRLQRLSLRPILPADFASAAFDASSEVDRAVALDGYNPNHNLLTANEASAETDATGWVNGGNATIASSGAQAADGTKSVSMTAIAAGDMSAVLSNSKTVSPGDSITVLASIRANTTARSSRVGIQWRDVADAVISTSFGVAANDSNAAWTVYACTAVAPATAVKARIIVNVTAPALGEIHYTDKASIRRGLGTDWVPGGTAELNNDRTVSVAAVTVNGDPVSAAAKTAIDTYLQANREVNFIVNVMDPKYTLIDVHVDFKTATGYDPVATSAAIVASVNDYLSPANWGKPANNVWIESPVVYYNELIALSSSVIGVDRVTDLTVNIHGNPATRADVPIASPAGLTRPSTVTATAV